MNDDLDADLDALDLEALGLRPNDLRQRPTTSRNTKVHVGADTPLATAAGAHAESDAVDVLSEPVTRSNNGVTDSASAEDDANDADDADGEQLIGPPAPAKVRRRMRPRTIFRLAAAVTCLALIATGVGVVRWAQGDSAPPCSVTQGKARLLMVSVPAAQIPPSSAEELDGQLAQLKQDCSTTEFQAFLDTVYQPWLTTAPAVTTPPNATPTASTPPAAELPPDFSVPDLPDNGGPAPVTGPAAPATSAGPTATSGTAVPED